MPEECMISRLNQTIWPWALFRSQPRLLVTCVFNKSPADTDKSSLFTCCLSIRFVTLSAPVFEPTTFRLLAQCCHLEATCGCLLVHVCMCGEWWWIVCVYLCAHLGVLALTWVRICVYPVVYHSCANKIFSLLLALIREGISNSVCVLVTVASPISSRPF
jgi:hypothetical protein